MNQKIEVITPAVAKRWLEKNDGNRPLNQAHVDFLVREMKHDNFRLTGDTIKFSKSDKLIDGQHRLTAVVISQKTIQSYVVWGLEDRVFEVLDTGRNRQAGDVLGINGCQDPNNMAAMIKYMMGLKKGKHKEISFRGGNSKMSNTDVNEYYKKHQESLEASLLAASKAKCQLMTKSKLAGWHYYLKSLAAGDADQFIQSIGDGANLGKTSPIYVLREKLTADKLRTNGLAMQENHKAALIIKAWNAFRKSKPMTRLSYDATKEDFPKPI